MSNRILIVFINLLLPYILFFGISSFLILGIFGEGATYSRFSKEYGNYINIGYFLLGIIQLGLIFWFSQWKLSDKILLVTGVVIMYLIIYLKFF